MLPNIGNAYSIQIVIRKSKPLERKGTTSAAGVVGTRNVKPAIIMLIN